MKTVTVIADIHGNLPSFRKFLGRNNPDVLINAGDVIGYNPFPDECISLLRETKAINLLGDHEWCLLHKNFSMINPYARKVLEWSLGEISQANIDFIKNFNFLEKTEVEKIKIAMCHGSPKDPLWEYIYPGTLAKRLNEFLTHVGADILILAHTHIPFVRKVKNGLIINPGSIGQPRDGNPSPSFITIEIEGDVVKNVKLNRYSYDLTKVINKIIDENLPKFLAERLYMGI